MGKVRSVNRANRPLSATLTGWLAKVIKGPAHRVCAYPYVWAQREQKSELVRTMRENFVTYQATYTLAAYTFFNSLARLPADAADAATAPALDMRVLSRVLMPIAAILHVIHHRNPQTRVRRPQYVPTVPQPIGQGNQLPARASPGGDS